MEYLLHLIVLITLYTVLAQSLNLSAGLTGLVSLAHAGFYGIGAYTAAILSQQYHISFWVNLPLAILVCLAVSLVVSVIALRTVDDYFIICTLGIQVIIFAMMNNWITLTSGPSGIAGIPPISVFGFTLEGKVSFLSLSITLMLIAWYVLANIFRSAFGRTLLAISEDEIYTESLGKNIYASKVLSYAISAGIAAVPGALYAHYISYIDPTSFTVSESVFILSIVIIGGTGKLTGSFLAAAFVILLPEFLRFIGLPNSGAANVRQILYGMTLVALMMTGKNGLAALAGLHFREWRRRLVVK